MGHVVNSRRIAEIISGLVDSLESEYEIEDLLISINNMKDNISFLENLKRKRAKDIQSEIDNINDRISILEKFIESTLKDVNRKSLNFPGVGKVTIVNRNGKWTIKDEEKLLEILEQKDKAAYDKVVSTKPIIAKKALDEILDSWEDTGMVPDCVKHEESRDCIKINFEKDIEVEDEVEDVIYDTDKVENEDKKKFDGLEI